MTKLAIINKEKCKPALCNNECKKVCPIEKKEKDSCITINEKATIDEEACIGCAICQKRCPFSAIEIINLPSINQKDLIHRYGKNGFCLYKLPTPKPNTITGILGRNGIGKSTAIKILSNQEKINLGKESATKEEIKEFFKGNEITKYFDQLENKTISYKPQNLQKLSKDIKVIDLLEQRGEKHKIVEISKILNIDKILNNKLNTLSGGELQRVAILASTLKESDIYFFDEPLAYLDIKERLRISDYIKKISQNKTTIIVEHDILILDYLTDYLHIFYGSQGAFGVVSQIKASKNGVNSYLHGFLKEENTRIRDKEIKFNFTKNPPLSGEKIGSWPNFKKSFKQGFTLNVEKGEIHKSHCIGILGKNGTGKTTFIKCLEGEEEVEINNKKQKLNLKLKISYKPQYLLNESEELVKEIIFKEKINKKLSSTFNLGILETKKIKELSGGELQRFSIARCLSKEADIYLLDEPSAYLDVEERIQVAKSIKEIISEKEKTAFIIDHDLLLISYLADSIINFNGISGVEGKSSQIKEFQEGISDLLKSLDITLRKDKESQRPRINKKDSVLDREQKQKKEWVKL
jgi:ATP-binding cassette, sub-family E, member 1